MDPEWVKNFTKEKLNLNNSSNSSSSELPPLDALEWPLQVFLIILYSATAGLSFAANAVTIIVLFKGERCAKDVRKFLINLSIADIGMALFSIPFTYTLYMFGRWIFPPIMCPIVNFVQLSSMIVSVYTLAAIGVDRYFAIVHPLRSSISWFKSHRRSIISLIWLAGISIGSTQLFISRSNPFEYDGQMFYDCKEQLAQGSETGKLYTLIVFGLTFILPMIILCLVYTLMGFTLIRHHLPGNETIHHRFASRRIKVIKMLSTVVILFAVCWLPIQLFGICVWFYPRMLEADTPFQYYMFVGMYFFCHWISMAHSFMNPIIYSFMSENFRYDLKLLLRKCCRYFECKSMAETQNRRNIRIHSAALNKSAIINGNKKANSIPNVEDMVTKSDDNISVSITNTLTTTYV